jgi:hypothetical protein
LQKNSQTGLFLFIVAEQKFGTKQCFQFNMLTDEFERILEHIQVLAHFREAFEQYCFIKNYGRNLKRFIVKHRKIEVKFHLIR